MNPQQFDTELQKAYNELKKYVVQEFPRNAGEKSLRFINGNFRAQGWQGNAFMPWKKIQRKGTILVHKGRLRRGTKMSTMPGAVRIYNDVPYAAVHNSGFNGIVNIPEHKRVLTQKSKVGTGVFNANGKEKMKRVDVVSGIQTVKSHTLKMNIAKRQFMPTGITDSPVLQRAIARDIENVLKTIF
jgi:phage gpG-like protein